MSELYMTEVMDYVYTLSPDFLAHHGIKGQRWGVRRFQTLSGSLTAAGLKRYGSKLRDRASNLSDTASLRYGIAKAKATKFKNNAEYRDWNVKKLKNRATNASAALASLGVDAALKTSVMSKATRMKADSFLKDMSDKYSNKKIDALDYINRKGVNDLIDKISGKSTSSVFNDDRYNAYRDKYESVKSSLGKDYKVDYTKRATDAMRDVGRISSYFNDDTSNSRRSDKISSYLKNNSDTYFDKAKESVTGARKKAMDNFERNLNRSETGRSVLDTATKRAVDSFASNVSNMSASQIRDESSWQSQYQKMGNRYVAEIANVRF